MKLCNVNLLTYTFIAGVPSCSAEVTVNLKVTDHSVPVFEKQFYGLKIPENMEPNTPLPVTITASSIYGSPLIYSIIGGDLYEEFSVNFTTGNRTEHGNNTVQYVFLICCRFITVF